MRKYGKYILGVVVFAAFLALAVFGYNRLSANYVPEGQTVSSDLTEVQPQTSASQNAAVKATDFTVIDKDGKKVKLSDFFGKPIVVNFWATWCGPCKSEFPAFDNMYKEYGDKVEFLMVNLTDGYRDTVDSVKNFISESGYSFPVYFDTEYSAANAYTVGSIPMSLFINSDGVFVNYHIGSMNENVLKGNIEKLLGDAK